MKESAVGVAVGDKMDDSVVISVTRPTSLLSDKAAVISSTVSGRGADIGGEILSIMV